MKNKIESIVLSDNLRQRIEKGLERLDLHALAIIRAGVQIEIILNEVLQAKFINGISVSKVVGNSFARVIHLSYALGIVEQKTYESLLNFKKVRDRCAHSSDFISLNITLQDAKNMTLFLGKGTVKEIERRGSCYVEWHEAALQLLVERVKKEALAGKLYKKHTS